MNFLITLILLLPHPGAAAETCASLSEKAEKASAAGSSVTEPVAKAAIEACLREHVKTARPYMVLAVLANRAQRYTDVIKWSEKGLQQEPGLALAYMNICSAQSQMKQYDAAVATCKKGLAKKSEWSAILNSNIGLALFQKAVDQSKFSETLAAEPYFKESKRLDATIAQNDFYLGSIEENVKMNAKAALPLYDNACKLGSNPACDAIPRATKAAGAPETTQPRQVRAATQGAAAPASLEEEKLWGVLVDSYVKRGLSADAAKKNVDAMRRGMQQLSSEQRVNALKTMTKQMQ